MIKQKEFKNSGGSDSSLTWGICSNHWWELIVVAEQEAGLRGRLRSGCHLVELF
jgi:hypothetical protein